MELEKLQFGVGCKTSSDLSAGRAVLLPELIFLYLGLHAVLQHRYCQCLIMARMLPNSHPSHFYALLRPQLFH